MSKSTNNNINISSSCVDDISNGIEKVTIAADDGDASSTRSEENTKKDTSCEQKIEHTKTDDTSSNSDNVEQDSYRRLLVVI